MMTHQAPTRRWRLYVHAWLLARALPMMVWTLRLSRLVEAMTPTEGRTPYRDVDEATIVRCVERVTRRPITMRGQRCLRQGLLAFYLLRLSGRSAVLHMGLEPASLRDSRARGHAWVSIAGRCVLNPPTDAMVQVHCYGEGPGAAMVQPPEASA